MREGVMADVMQERGGGDGVEIGRARLQRRGQGRPERVQRPSHQRQDAEGVLEAAVLGSGPHAGDEAQLPDAVEAQELGGAQQRDLTRAQGNAVVEAVAHRRQPLARLLKRQVIHARRSFLVVAADRVSSYLYSSTFVLERVASCLLPGQVKGEQAGAYPLLFHLHCAPRSGYATCKAGGRGQEVGYARLEATVAAVCRGPALHIAILERPGLGLTLDLEEIARHPYQQTVYLPLFRAGGSGATPLWGPRRTEASRRTLCSTDDVPAAQPRKPVAPLRCRGITRGPCSWWCAHACWPSC